MNDNNIIEAIHWLQYANEDLITAGKMIQEGGYVYRHACFWSQQAAEKALKAIFVFLQVEYPLRHDLDALRLRLPDDWSVKNEQIDLARLTEWAVEARYPGDWGEATFDDARVAFDQAKAVVESISKEFYRRGIFNNHE